jgi:gamma-glutamylcyclotransferase (GGCT)/AIG2-like uncharacterized protein YtfP
MDSHVLYSYQTATSSSNSSTIQSNSPTPPMAGEHTAFFYGTLMSPRVLHRVCHGPSSKRASKQSNSTTHHPLTIKPALLQGYRRHRVRHADYPAIVDDPSGISTVRGTLVSGLTEGDIWRLDIFEGPEYHRRKVTARPIVKNKETKEEPNSSDLGEGVECETYVWISDRRDLEDSEWDFEEFVREKIGRWVGDRAEQEGEYDGMYGWETRPSILGPSLTRRVCEEAN